eukprot:ANDGO_07728.mRNA.1 hypothetical protein
MTSFANDMWSSVARWTLRSWTMFRNSRIGSILIYDVRYAFQLRFLLDLLLVALVLLVENGLVVIASAQEIPAAQNKPLVDHFRNFLNNRPDWYAVLAWTNNNPVTVFTAQHFLEIGIVVAVLRAEMRLVQRVLRTLQIVRFSRWFTFTITILPSGLGPECQINKGYAEMDLSSWTFGDWMRETLLHPKFGGGCHDLLFSGHCVLYTCIGVAMFVLCSRIRGRRPWVRRLCYLLTSLFAYTLIPFGTIKDGLHYTVDIIIAFYLTVLVFLFVPYVRPRESATLLLPNAPASNASGVYRRMDADVEPGTLLEHHLRPSSSPQPAPPACCCSSSTDHSPPATAVK